MVVLFYYRTYLKMLHTFYEWNATEYNINFQSMCSSPGLMTHLSDWFICKELGSDHYQFLSLCLILPLTA